MIQVFGLVFIVVGGIIAFFLIRQIMAAAASGKWPSVWGKIGQAGTKRVTVRDPGERVGGHTTTQVDYSYTYEVNGTTYTGTRVTFSDKMIKTGGSLQKVLEKYIKDDQVQVFYNPNNPASAVLQPGPTVYNFTPLITAGLFIALGCWLTFFAKF